MARSSLATKGGKAALAVLLCVFTTAGAIDQRQHVRVDGLDLSVSVASSVAIRGGHAKDHPEQTMHGGKPAPGEQHLLVSIRDRRTARQIADAEVLARVTGARGYLEEKPLEAMTIANAPGYGNYFALPGDGPIAVALEIRVATSATPIKAHVELRRN